MQLQRGTTAADAILRLMQSCRGASASRSRLEVFCWYCRGRNIPKIFQRPRREYRARIHTVLLLCLEMLYCMGFAFRLDQLLKKCEGRSVEVARITACYLNQRSKDVVTDFKQVSIPSRDSVDKSQLQNRHQDSCNNDYRLPYGNSKLKSLLVAFKVLKQAEMRRQQVCFDEYLDWQICYNTTFVPQQICTEGQG